MIIMIMLAIEVLMGVPVSETITRTMQHIVLVRALG